MLATVKKIGPVLALFTAQRPEWGISEISQELEVPKSSIHGMTSSMVDVGLLRRTQTSRYRLGWRLVHLGRNAIAGMEDRETIGTILRREAARTGDTMHFAVYDNDAIVYLDKVEGSHAIRTPSQIGVRLPAHISAVGKVLLAFQVGSPYDLPDVARLPRYTGNTIVEPNRLIDELGEIRERCVAFDDEEAVSGICCAGAPIHDADGKVLGAISLATSEPRFTKRRDAYRRTVKEISDEISQRLAESLPEPLVAAPA